MARVKKLSMALLTLLFILMFIPSVFASEKSIETVFTLNQAEYKINGMSGFMDCTPIIHNQKVFVPLRFLANGCGINNENIKWNNDTQTVELTSGKINVSLQVGNNILVKNNEIKNIDTTPILKENRVYLPARLVAEAFGYEVIWNDTDKTITIKPDTSADKQQIELTIRDIFNPEYHTSTDKYLTLFDKSSQYYKDFNKNAKDELNLYKQLNFKIPEINIIELSESKATAEYQIISTKKNKNFDFADRKATIKCYLNKTNDVWGVSYFDVRSVELLD